MRLLAITLLVGLACGSKQDGSDGFKPAAACETPRAPTGAELPRLARYPGGGAWKTLAVDIDGDRAPDQLVSKEGLCDRFGNCAHRIYLMRGKCGHPVGALWARRARSAPPAQGALGDLVTTTADAGGEFEEWYQWVDGKYQCKAFRERPLYKAGRLDPQATWGAWEGCEP